MVATDTVVGVVGAVVLVAVMAGVFVYEYNNAPTEELTPAEQREHFEEDYAGLSATQDLDGDGTANFEDDDIDGDGLNNTDDPMLSTFVPIAGSVEQSTPAAPGDPYTQTFTVGNGSEALDGSFTYQRTNGQVASPSLTATISGPGGYTLNGASTTSGNTVTVTFTGDEPLEPGQYTLTVSHAPLAGPLSIAPAAAISGNLEVHYATPAAEDVHSH